MQRTLLIIALVLGLLVDGFFALVNFYPVAPTRSRGPRRYILADVDATQAAWLQHNLLDEFNDEHHANLALRAVDEEHIEEAMNRPDVLLAVLPRVTALRAINTGHVASFEDFVPAARIASDFDAIRSDVMQSGRYRNRQAFIPRAVVLDVAVYRQSRVRDAMLHWRLLEADMNAALRAVNGRGLPAGYSLEREPTSWDAYDQFVLAYYWAHRSYDGHPARARVAHRSGLLIEGQIDIVGSIYRAGGSDATLDQHDSVFALDAMQWDAVYRAEGLFADEMFAPTGLDDEDALAGLERGDFYLTSADQLEAFSIHGGGHRDANPRVPDEDDLGFVAMPRFSSLELDATGHPARTAAGFSFREEFVWALPAHGPDRRVAYDAVRWVMERENHARECEALGMLPIRTDVIRERATLFRIGWMQDVFEAGLSQWARSQPLPLSFATGSGLDYAILWDRVVAQHGAAPSDRAAIAAMMRAPIDRDAAQRVAAAAQQADEAEDNSATAAAPEPTAFAAPPLRDRVVIERAHDSGNATDASAPEDGR